MVTVIRPLLSAKIEKSFDPVTPSLSISQKAVDQPLEWTDNLIKRPVSVNLLLKTTTPAPTQGRQGVVAWVAGGSDFSLGGSSAR